SDDRCPVSGRQLDRQDIGYRAVLIPAARKRISADRHQENAATVTDKIDHHFQLLLLEEGRFDASENQPLVIEKLLGFGWKPFGKHFFLIDALAVKLVLRRSQI